MSGEEAAMWAGRLQWGCATVYGRAGRAYLRPLYWRRAAGGGRAPMTKRLRVVVDWWRRFLSEAHERVVPWTDPPGGPDTVVWTDAESTGHVGVVCLEVGSGYLSAVESAVPRKWRRRFVRRATQINAYETAAVLGALGSLGETLRGRRAVFFIDSTAAMGSILRGHHRRSDLNLLVGTIWRELGRLQIHAHFERVPSKSNIADGPSRGDRELLEDLDAEWLEASWVKEADGLW